MTDDLTGPPGERPRDLPEFPLAGPPTVPPAMTPPPDGTPPPGRLAISYADGWRWFHAALAFVGGFVAAQIAVLILGAIWIAFTGTKFEALDSDSTFVLVASAVNELFFIGSAYFVARLLGPVSLRDFGLLRAPLWGTIWKMAVVMAAYFVLLGVYSELVHLAPDTAPEKLGASTSNLHMLFFAILVGVLAPIGEEFFFRGFLYRALRNGLGVLGAAIVSGLLFGALHIDSSSTERLLQVVPLAVLGISFALLYQWTGTLYSTIALHATNNSIAVAAYADKHDSQFGIVVAAIVWLLMMLGCLLGPRLTDKRDRRSLEYALDR